MELKRIIARDSRRATEQAIQQYGKDILVISTQRIDDQVELIVAVDGAPEQSVESNQFKPASPPLALAAVSEPLNEAAKQAETERTEADDSGFAGAFAGAFMAESRSKPEMGAGAAAIGEGAADADGSAEDAAVSAAISRSAEEAYELQRSREIVALLREEVSALRQEFSLTRKYALWQNQGALPPTLAPIAEHLQESGVPAGLRTLLMDSLHGCDSTASALAAMRQLLADALAAVPQSSPAQGIHALCGPSGAGKTTMTARLAAAAAERLGVESQAIISFQDTRPGAWAQLQMLAAQTGVDCFRASSEESLALLLDELGGRRNVWVDTSGVDFMKNPGVLARMGKEISLHAVLPLDATVANVRKVFAVAGSWSSLMLAKFDEAAHPWPLMQALCDQPLAVSAMVSGERVGERLAAFDVIKLVDAALTPVAAALQASAVACDDEATYGPPLKAEPWAAARASLQKVARNHV